jgi:sec-independent protein translocase protein TatA
MLAQIVTPHFINNIGPGGLVLIAIVVLVLFGRGKIASLMGEVGKGITAFKKGVKESTDEIADQRDQADTTPVVPPPGVQPRDVTPTRDRDNA